VAFDLVNWRAPVALIPAGWVAIRPASWCQLPAPLFPRGLQVLRVSVSAAGVVVWQVAGLG
jgi:hypothetical protein